MAILTPNTNLSPGSIKTVFIKDSAVTNAKIADGSITAAKIADGTVVAAELASDSVTTIKIADDAVTLAKISTSGASDNQVLTYDAGTTSVVWENAAAGYTDAEAITAVEGEATLDLTGKASISNSAGLLTPILKLVTDNSGWDKAHLLLEDSNDDAVTIVGRNNTANSNYQLNYTLDPNNTKPRTNVTTNNAVTAGSFVATTSYTILTAGTTDFTLIGAADSVVGTVFTATGVGSGTGTAYPGNGITWAGDYFVNFRKNYANQDYIEMMMEVYGANDGFAIVARDDWNGGVDSYNYKPIVLKGSEVGLYIGTTPYGATVEKLAVNDYGTSVSNGPLVIGKDRTSSNFQISYTGSDTTGDPDAHMFMHNRGDDRTVNVLKAWDMGSGTEAHVSLPSNVSIGNSTASANLQVTSWESGGVYWAHLGLGSINANGGMGSTGGFDVFTDKIAFSTPIQLNNLATAHEPTGALGQMYYNTSTNKFRGYTNAGWVDLH